MKRPRHQFLHLAAAAAVLLVSLTADRVWSQTTRAIKIVVTFPARSGGDLLTRAMAEHISREHGPSFTFENADQFIGTEKVSHAAPDGNTLLVLNNNFSVNAKLRNPPYDPLTSFVPICNLASGPMLVIVDAASPYRTLGDLLTATRNKPGQVTISSNPLGPPQIGFEMLKRAAKVDIGFVPSTPAVAINALSNQRVTAAIMLYLQAEEQIKANKVRALAITSRTRKEALPDVPTVAEAGLTGYEVEYWDGIYAPAGTPIETVAQLASWFGSAAQAPEVKTTLTAQTYAPVGVCGPDFISFIHKELEEYGRVVREANIKAE
jgi:tripartite-type tricarboxylate transporter receptor subunit TctC